MHIETYLKLKLLLVLKVSTVARRQDLTEKSGAGMSGDLFQNISFIIHTEAFDIPNPAEMKLCAVCSPRRGNVPAKC